MATESRKVISQAEFVEKYRKEICGLIADAWTTDARGGELAIRMRQSFRAVDAALMRAYCELAGIKTPEPIDNGQPPKQETRK